MHKFLASWLISLLLFCPTACAKTNSSEIASALTAATGITLYSIEPLGAPRDRSGQCSSPCFRGWSMLGKVALHGNAMNTVTNELSAWLAAPEPEAVAMCFNPRHAVHVVTPKHTYDFIVCFECGHAEVTSIPQRQEQPTYLEAQIKLHGMTC